MNNKQHKSSKKNSKSEATMPRRPAKNFETQNSADGYYSLYHQTSDISSADLLNGTYMNAYFIRAFFKIYGREVEITVKNGAVYHGVLYSLSPRGDILLQCVHRIRGPGDDETKDIVIPSKDNLEDYLAFSCDDIVEMVSKNVDLDEDHHSAVNGTSSKNPPSFITDSQLGATAQTSFSRGENVVNGINGRGGGGGGPDRELTPWCPEENNNDMLDNDALDAGSDGCNGWSPEEMMQANRDNGVKETGFDEDLYTTHLDKSSEEYMKNLEWADKMARKIEQSTDYVSRNVESNNGDEDEEAKFSAVMRDNQNGTSSSNTSTLTSTPPPSDLGVGGSGMGGPVHQMQLSSSPGGNSREFTPVYSKRSGHRTNAGKNNISPYQHHTSQNQGPTGSPGSYSGAQSVSSPGGNNPTGGARGGAPVRQKHPGGPNTGTPGRFAGGATGVPPRQFISSSRAQQKAASNIFDPSGSGGAGPNFNAGGGSTAQNQPPTQVNPNSNISPAQSTPTFPSSGNDNSITPASHEHTNVQQLNSGQQQQQQANGHMPPSYSSAISRGSMGHQQATPINPSQANKIGKFKNFSANVTISSNRGPSPGQNYPETSPKHSAGGAGVKTPSMTPTKGNAWERPPVINSATKAEEQMLTGSAQTSQTAYQGHKQQTPQLMSQNSLPSPSKNSTPISVKKETSEGSLAETSVASSSSGGDELKSSEKSTSDVTSSAEKSISNSSSSAAVASSAEEVDESDLVKNSKLNVNAQAFKPSGNYFTPAAQTQEPSVEEQQSNNAYYQSSPASDVAPLAAQMTQMSISDDQASMAAAAAAAQFHQGIPAAAATTNFAVPFHPYFTQTAFPNGAAPTPMFHQPLSGQIPMSIHSLTGVSAGAAPHLSAGVPAFAPQRAPLLHGSAQNIQVQFPSAPNILQQTGAGPNGSFNGTSSPTYPSVRANRPRAPLRGPHPPSQQYLNTSMPNVAGTASALGVAQSAAPPNTAGTVAVSGAQMPYQHHPALAAVASNASSAGSNGNAATNSGLMQPQPVFPYPQHAIFGGTGNPGMYSAQAIPGPAAASGGANISGPPPGGLISITPQGAAGASGPMAANQAQLQGGNAPPYLHPNASGPMYPQSLYPAHVRMALPHGAAMIDGNNSSATVPFVGHAIAATGPGGGPLVANSGSTMAQGTPMFQHGNPGAAGHAHHVANMQGGPTTNIQPALVAAAVAAGNSASANQQNPNSAAAAAAAFQQQQQQQNQLIQQEYANSYPPLPSLSANSESIGRATNIGDTINHGVGGPTNVDMIAQQEMHPPMVSSPYYNSQIHLQSENGGISVNSHSEFPTLQHHQQQHVRSMTEGQMIPGVHLQQQVENESLRNSFNRGVAGGSLAGQASINDASRQQIARSERRESEGSGLSVEMQNVNHNHPSHNVNSGGNQIVNSQQQQQQQQQSNSQQSQQQQQQQQQQALTAVMAANAAAQPNQHLIHAAAPNQQPHLAPRPAIPPAQQHMNLVYLQGPNMAAAVAQQQAQHLAGMQQQIQQQQHRNSISGPSGHDFHRSNSQEVNGGNGGGK